MSIMKPTENNIQKRIHVQLNQLNLKKHKKVSKAENYLSNIKESTKIKDKLTANQNISHSQS